jgi:hypothetical protein
MALRERRLAEPQLLCLCPEAKGSEGTRIRTQLRSPTADGNSTVDVRDKHPRIGQEHPYQS